MFYPLPRSQIVNREQFIVDFCAGKKVVHLGAAQGNDANDFDVYASIADPETFLHARITRVVSRCVGVDYNRAFVDYLQTRHGIRNIICADIEDPILEFHRFRS